jgi:protein-S-isoprenylcysteine O-methyltransferase Ste14
MADSFRIWFSVAYLAGFLFFVALIFSFRRRRPAVEQRRGPLPPPPAVMSWLVPPIILLLDVGQIPVAWMAVRVVGVALGLYAFVVMPWATSTLGRSYAPGPAILEDHALVTSGPFRFVRHPIYSAVAALWLGAALGTLNWILLLLWPGLFMALMKGARAEEEMLRAKLGDAYDSYAGSKGRLIPSLTFRGT